MHYTKTNGEVVFVPDQCSFCNMNTAGQHEYKCPLYTPNNIKFHPKYLEDLKIDKSKEAK
jgi:hypothetical protein